MSWLLAFAGFALLIILHEAGHFAAAKAVGMRVERFSLFFPPLIARKKIGETEYAIGAIPAGGYVKITGMNPSEELSDEARTRAYYSQPVWKRIVVIAAGPAVNLVIGLVLIFVYAAAIGVPIGNGIGSIQKGYPAHGGLRLSDQIVAVDGRKVDDPGKIASEIGKHRCPTQPPKAGCKAKTPVTMTVRRDGRLTTVRLAPVYDATAKRMRLGFGFDPNSGPRKRESAGNSVTITTQNFWRIVKLEASLPARILNAHQRKQIHGIVGNYEITRQTLLKSPADVVWIMAVISLALAIVNLFPFLPLDGGHIFWAIVEKVRRRPVPFSTMERSGLIGAALVVMLFLVGLTNDVSTLSNGGFKVR